MSMEDNHYFTEFHSIWTIIPQHHFHTHTRKHKNRQPRISKKHLRATTHTQMYSIVSERRAHKSSSSTIKCVYMVLVLWSTLSLRKYNFIIGNEASVYVCLSLTLCGIYRTFLVLSIGVFLSFFFHSFAFSSFAVPHFVTVRKMNNNMSR